MPGESRKAGRETHGARHRVGHRQAVADDRHHAAAGHGIDVFPNHVAASVHLDEVAGRGGANQGIAVTQALDAGTEVAEERMTAHRTVFPGHLAG